MGVSSSTAPFSLSDGSVGYSKIDFNGFNLITHETANPEKTFSLTAAQTNYDFIIVYFEGYCTSSNDATQYTITPPLTGAVSLIQAYSAASVVRVVCAGYRILIAGTDYTKNTGADFVIGSTGSGAKAAYSTTFIGAGR